MDTNGHGAPVAPVKVRTNPKRASVLAQEADVAAAEGAGVVEAWLRERAFGYLVGQRE